MRFMWGLLADHEEVFHPFGPPMATRTPVAMHTAGRYEAGWNEALQKHRPDRAILQQIAASAMPCRAGAFTKTLSGNDRNAGRTRESERSGADIRQLRPAVPDRGEIGRQWRHLAHIEAALDRIVKIRGA